MGCVTARLYAGLVPDSAPAIVVSQAGDPSEWLALGDQSWLAEAAVIYKCASAMQATQTLAAMASATSWWPHVEAAEGCWIVTSRPAGEGAHQPERHGQIGGLAELAGQTLRDLHDASVGEQIDQTGWEVIADRVAKSEVEAETLPEPFRRYTRDRLIELWSGGRPAAEDLVLSHGRPRLENLFVNATAFTGWVEPRYAVVADRHLDLAIAHRSIQDCLGNDAVFRFYEAYGSDPSLVSLEHYLLADLMMP